MVSSDMRPLLGNPNLNFPEGREVWTLTEDWVACAETVALTRATRRSMLVILEAHPRATKPLETKEAARSWPRRHTGVLDPVAPATKDIT